MGLVLRLVVNAAALAAAAWLFDGISSDSPAWLLATAAVFGIVNAVVRPVVTLLALPLIVLTLGVFLLVVNALMLLLVDAVAAGFHVAGFGTALGGAVVISIVSWALSLVLPDV